jgi:hypothetical protein
MECKSQLRSCKYEELIDYEEDLHEPDCNQQPSTCHCEEVSWIWAFQPDHDEPIRSGKWLLFPDKLHVNEVWEKIKILLAANRLGNGAKVSIGVEQFVICVYTNDFENTADVFRVLMTLQRNRLQLVNRKNKFLNYKTDEATSQGLYTSDEAAQREGFDSATKRAPGQKVSMYNSPIVSANDVSGATEIIQLFKNNIGPEFKTGLVMQLIKGKNDSEPKFIIFNPPQIKKTAATKFQRKQRAISSDSSTK